MLINVNSTTLFYEKAGSGHPLIMLHGNGETHDIFDKAMPLLSKRFTVYALDTRGHGQSAPASEYHYQDMAEDVFCFITALALEKPVFYGFSDGAIIGILLASKHPELFSRLILSGANLRPEGIRPFWLRLFKLIYKKTADPKMKMMLEEPSISKAELSKITAPTTVIAGGRDMVLRAHTQEIARGIKGSRLIILPLYGHGSYIVHRRKIAKLILAETDGD